MLFKNLSEDQKKQTDFVLAASKYDANILTDVDTAMLEKLLINNELSYKQLTASQKAIPGLILAAIRGNPLSMQDVSQSILNSAHVQNLIVPLLKNGTVDYFTHLSALQRGLNPKLTAAACEHDSTIVRMIDIQHDDLIIDLLSRGIVTDKHLTDIQKKVTSIVLAAYKIDSKIISKIDNNVVFELLKMNPTFNIKYDLLSVQQKADSRIVNHPNVVGINKPPQNQSINQYPTGLKAKPSFKDRFLQLINKVGTSTEVQNSTKDVQQNKNTKL